MRLTSQLTFERVFTYLAVAAVLLVTVVVLPATGAFERPTASVASERVLEGEVIDIAAERREVAPSTLGLVETIGVRVNGERLVIERRSFDGDAQIEVRVGDSVLLSATETPNGTRYLLIEHVRRPAMAMLAVSLALLVLAIGGWRGAASIVGLAASGLVLIRFVVPAILAGSDPVYVSILGSLVIMSTTLFVAHGVHRRTVVALAGTAVALVITAVLAIVSIAAANLAGIGSEEAVTLQILSSGAIDARGLLLGSIVIGALGVLDDVTTTQAAAVFEIRSADPSLGARSLYRRGMNVGREHIASTMNTLVLAYAGASLPLLVIFAAGSEPWPILVNRELLATEIVRTLVGSIGLVSAVPATTGLAAIAAGHGSQRAQFEEVRLSS